MRNAFYTSTLYEGYKILKQEGSQRGKSMKKGRRKKKEKKSKSKDSCTNESTIQGVEGEGKGRHRSLITIQEKEKFCNKFLNAKT